MEAYDGLGGDHTWRVSRMKMNKLRFIDEEIGVRFK